MKFIMTFAQSADRERKTLQQVCDQVETKANDWLESTEANILSFQTNLSVSDEQFHFVITLAVETHD